MPLYAGLSSGFAGLFESLDDEQLATIIGVFRDAARIQFEAAAELPERL